MLKLDESGELIQQKAYGGDGWEEASCIQETSEGGYVVAGYTDSYGAGNRDAWILKLDASLDIEWQKTYGGTENDRAYAIREVSTGGYIVTGRIDSYGSGRSDLWLLKLDVMGNIEWEKAYGGTMGEHGNSLQETQDGGFVVQGERTDKIWLLKLDSLGNVEWQRVYGWSLTERAHSVVCTRDGGIGIAGATNSFYAGDSGYDIWVLKLNSNGEVGSCPFIEDTSATVVDTTAIVQDTTSPVKDIMVETMDSSAHIVDTRADTEKQCPPCIELSCDSIGVDPESGCEGGSQVLTAVYAGGEGPVTVEWDFDGDTIPDDTGNPVTVSFAAGSRTVSATVTDSCADPDSQSCAMSTLVTVNRTPVPNITALGPTDFCAPEGESVTLEADGGYDSYQWTRDGEDIPGGTSRSYEAMEGGDYAVTVTDSNGCEGVSDTMRVNAEACPPGVVSDVSAGEPPLIANSRENSLTMENEILATAYNVYADALGSWYSPTQATGTVCGIRSWTDNGDGTITLDYVIPKNSWIVVTASNEHGEGPAGQNSAAIERTELGTWERCGAAP